jgi:hypothetical protein
MSHADTKGRRIPALVALALSATLAGCFYSNPHDSQGLRPVSRFNTSPNGATVTLPRLNLTLSTPCDLDGYDITADDELIVRKEGYRTAYVKLGEVPQIALGTYELRLEKQ